jgi:peptidyl-prolyl cis-trans isomerase D
MLQSIRDKTTGILAWLIIGILTIPFVFVAFTDYDFACQGPPSVAYVGKSPVTKTEFNSVLRSRKEAYARQTKSVLNQEEEAKLKREILDMLVENRVLVENARQQGYHISQAQIDEFIQRDRVFHKDGKFDRARFDLIAAQNGFTYESYSQLLTSQMLRTQLGYSIVGSEFLTKAELLDLFKAQNREVAFSYFIVPSKSFAKKIKVTDEEVKAHYDKNTKDYMAEKKYKIQYLAVNYADFLKNAKVDEAKVKEYYENNKKNYRKDPIRKASHIFFKFKKGDKKAEAAALKRATETFAKLKKGEKFEALLKKVSDDKLSPNGDLGVIDSETNKAFYQAISSLKVGQYTSPVKSDNGYHILKVTFQKPGEIKTFAQAKKEVAESLKKKTADDAYRKKVEVMYNKTFSNPETLEVAAKELKLKIQTSDWISKSSRTGIAKHKKVYDALLGSDVFAGGDPNSGVNSEILEVNSSKANSVSYIIRLKEFVKAKPKPFDAVKKEIRAKLEKQKTDKLTAENGKPLFTMAEKEGKLDAAARKGGYKVTKVDKARRNSAKPSRDLVKAVFAAGVPKEKQTLIQSVQLDNGDYVVFQVHSSKPGATDKLKAQTKQFFSQHYSQMLGQNAMDAATEYMKSRAEIKYIDANLDSKK